VTERGYVNLVILDVSGRMVRKLFEGEGTPGNYSVMWDGEDDLGNYLPSGIYICVLKVGAFSQREKLLLFD
jgi:flagellar hook assembly protein FlgD